MATLSCIYSPNTISQEARRSRNYLPPLCDSNTTQQTHRTHIHTITHMTYTICAHKHSYQPLSDPHFRLTLQRE